MHTGFFNYDELYNIALYMIPEILIVVLLMLNDVVLRLNGLYYESEEDIETI